MSRAPAESPECASLHALTQFLATPESSLWPESPLRFLGYLASEAVSHSALTRLWFRCPQASSPGTRSPPLQSPALRMGVQSKEPGGRPVWAAAEMATGLVAGMAGNWKLSPSISQR